MKIIISMYRYVFNLSEISISTNITCSFPYWVTYQWLPHNILGLLNLKYEIDCQSIIIKQKVYNYPKNCVHTYWPKIKAVLRVYPMLCVCGVQRCYILYGCGVTGRCVVLYCSYLLGHAGSHKDTIHTPYSDQPG